MASPRREVTGAWLLMLGYASLFFGIAWDGQWHLDVGPDTFYTAPHLLFYVGSALTGLTSLAVVLAATRHGTDGPAPRVLGFRAPVPFLVAGLGAAAHLAYGATDLWWHTVYGFDITESTPSHLGLTLGMLLQAIGVVLAFAAIRETRSGRWGLPAAAAFGFISLNMQEENPLTHGTVLGVDMEVMYVGLTGALAVAVIAGVTRSPGWTLACGAAFAAIQGAALLFTPWATAWYADAIGLPYRDDAVRLPIIGLGLPILFPLATALGALVLWAAKRRGSRPSAAMAGAGVLAGLAAAVPAALGRSGLDPVVTFAAVVAGAGVAGWFGWHCAALLRRSAVTS